MDPLSEYQKDEHEDARWKLAEMVKAQTEEGKK